MTDPFWADEADAPPSGVRADRDGAGRRGVGWLLLLGAIAGGLLLAWAPCPYVIERPGPVVDTLGTVEIGGEEVPVIDVPDDREHEAGGRLDLLTVYIEGSREHPLSWIDVAVAWFDPSLAVLPVDVIFPAGQTKDERDEESAAAMRASQDAAVAAALGAVGEPVPSVVVVSEVVDGAPADGVLEADDRILTAGGAAVGTVQQLRDRIAESGAGAPIAIGVERDGERLELTLTPEPGDDGAPRIGVLAVERFEFPFEVDIQLEGIGGPSAGMVFALGIVDLLTPGELTGGEHVAGTGTIAPDGTVGPIGGVVQKAYGAARAGADWMLVPDGNCAELDGRVPGGLQVFAVTDLAEAVDVLTAIARDADLGRFDRCG